MAAEAIPAAGAPACLCGDGRYEVVCELTSAPVGEVRFALASGARYFRRLLRCRTCGHFRSVHSMDMSGLYEGAYVDSTYGADGIAKAFARIIGLPPHKSDNVGRVARVLEFAATHFGTAVARPSVMDVGSGLCVFLHRISSVAGWECTALDPDPRAVEHARKNVGINGICADFTRTEELGAYDSITLNKVLEHVLDPVAMLAKCRGHLRRGGFVYIELPDGEAAAEESFMREEFFIDHHHVFSLASTRLLAERAGFDVLRLDRLREPSSKYTLCAFLAPRPSR